MKVLFFNMLNASLHGSIVIMAVLALRLALKKAPRAAFCLLWLMAGIRLVLPFTIESRMSLQPDVPGFAQVQQEEIWGDRAGDLTLTAPPDQIMDAQTPALPQQTDGQEAPLPEDAQVFVSDDAVTDHKQHTVDYGAAAAWIWAAGMAALLGCSAWSYWKLRYHVREAVRQADGSWECSGLDTAFVLGLFRPRIYLPGGLSDRDRELILAHERAHIARRDHWIKPVGYLVLMLHWFNPLVWVAYACLCRDIEMACDERVVKSMDVAARKDYSRALLSCSSRRVGIAACPVAFGEVGVKQRIRSVLNYRKPGFWVMVAAVVAVVFVVVCLMTSPAARVDADSLLNYENAIELVENRKIVIGTRYRQNINGTISVCKADGDSLARVLEDAGWQDRLVGKSHDGFTAYVDFQLTGDLKVRIFDNGHADVILGEEIRHYRISKSAYEEAEALLSDATGEDVRAASEEMNAPVWNLTMSVKNIGTGGLTVVFTQSGSFPGSATGRLQYGSEYRLERWNGSTWEAVPYALEGEFGWTMLAYGIELNTAAAQDIDWRWLYGELSPGRYRITKGVTLFFEAGNSQDADFTAEFYLDGSSDFDISLGTATPDTWGMTLEVEDVTASGLTLVCRHGGEESNEIITGEAYTLYKKEGGGWVPVPMVQDDAVWQAIAWLVNLNGETRWQVDWEWLYGELPDGVYCLEKQFIRAGENSENEYLDLYLPFAVGAAQTGENTTDEERYLAMCRAALEEFQALDTGYVEWENQFYKNSFLDSHVTGGYWFDGGNWLRRATAERGTATRWHLGVGGSVFFKVEDNGPAESDWAAATAEGVDAIQPWLFSLDWDEGKINFKSAETVGEELQITLQVQGAPPGILNEEVTEHTVCFVFSGNGDLVKTVHSYETDGTKGISTMTIPTSAEESPADVIADTCVEVLGYIPKTAEEYLAMCRAALEEFQARDSYHVIQQDFYAGSILNSTTVTNYWKSGDDWLHIVQQPDVDNGHIVYRVKKDGLECWRELCNTLGEDPYGCPWSAAEEPSDCMDGNWLGVFNWENSGIEYVSTDDTNDDGIRIRLTVTKDSSAFGRYCPYTVEFSFEPDGSFSGAYLCLEENKGEQDWCVIDSIYNIDYIESVDEQIDDAYQEACSALNCTDPNCTDVTHNHYGIACTVEHCDNPAHGHGDHDHH